MKLWLLSTYLFFNSSLTSLNNSYQQKTNIISINPHLPKPSRPKFPTPEPSPLPLAFQLILIVAKRHPSASIE